MNRIRNGILGLLLTGIAATGFAQKQPPAVYAFSIQQCVDFAHQHNAQVKNAILDLQIQQQSNKATTAGALPSISGTASTTDYFQTPVTLVPAEFFGGAPGTYQALSFLQQYNASGGLQLNQVLFDGQVFVGLQARKASIDYQQKAVDITEENIKVNIYKVYYQLVVSKTQMEQIDANVARAEKLLNDTKALYQNGFSEKLDVDKATVQLANIETQKLSTQITIANGYLGLKYLLGMPIKDSVALTDKFTEEDIKSGVLDDSIYRYEDRNDYQSLAITRKLNEYNIKRYKYNYLPTANLVGAYQKNAYSNTYDFFGKNATWYSTSYAQLNINVPIFSGFAKNANLKKARLQLQQVQNQMEYLKVSIDNDVEQSKNKFRSAITTMDFQKRNMALAESVYNQTKKKFESGVASNTDVTNAQTDFITAQTNYINALYDAVVAKVDYNKATGRLK
jgi:outer membrane protein